MGMLRYAESTSKMATSVPGGALAAKKKHWANVPHLQGNKSELISELTEEREVIVSCSSDEREVMDR